MEQFMTAEFWVAVGQIIMIDILLGGDNAVVIALACRKLPPTQRTKGIIWGTAGAIVLRVILIFFALTLLAIPYLKLVGAVLLVWIGVKLLAARGRRRPRQHPGQRQAVGRGQDRHRGRPGDERGQRHRHRRRGRRRGGDHQMPLVIFGLLVSIPIIVWGSQLVIKLMDRFPIIITVGGMLLGWIAGTMAVTDPAVVGLPAQHAGRQAGLPRRGDGDGPLRRRHRRGAAGAGARQADRRAAARRRGEGLTQRASMAVPGTRPC